jgi:hypothetical protein
MFAITVIVERKLRDRAHVLGIYVGIDTAMQLPDPYFVHVRRFFAFKSRMDNKYVATKAVTTVYHTNEARGPELIKHENWETGLRECKWINGQGELSTIVHLCIVS